MEGLAMASLDGYELKIEKKKSLGTWDSTGLYLISQEELIKKKMKNGRKTKLVQQETSYMARKHTHAHTVSLSHTHSHTQYTQAHALDF